MKIKNFKKLLLLSLLCISIFLAGIWVGTYIECYRLTKKFWKNTGSLARLMTIAAYGQYAHLQYQNAGYDEAREALLDFIDLWEEMKDEKGPFLRDKTYYIDTALAYSRLAILEERSGHPEEMQKYFKEAQNRFRSGGWKEISEARIRVVLNRLDSKWPEPQ